MLRKLLRYCGVSIVSTVTGLSVLGILVGGFNAPAGWSNIAATAVGTLPSFELNRRWVWGKRGRRSLGREVTPFVALSFLGLAFSTLVVHLAASWATRHGWDHGARTALVEAANVIAYGSLWVVQFLLLERVLFRTKDVVLSGQA